MSDAGPGPIPIPPEPTPPDPTPPKPKTYSIWAFDRNDPKFRDKPPLVPVEVDEDHTRVKFYLFGSECQDIPVGKVYFHIARY